MADSINLFDFKQQPLTLLDTDIGVQQVDQVLGRIEHGIVG